MRDTVASMIPGSPNPAVALGTVGRIDFRRALGPSSDSAACGRLVASLRDVALLPTTEPGWTLAIASHFANLKPGNPAAHAVTRTGD